MVPKEGVEVVDFKLTRVHSEPKGQAPEGPEATQDPSEQEFQGFIKDSGPWPGGARQQHGHKRQPGLPQIQRPVCSWEDCTSSTVQTAAPPDLPWIPPHRVAAQTTLRPCPAPGEDNSGQSFRYLFRYWVHYLNYADGRWWKRTCT